MDFTEIAVALITTGPAYIAVWWAVRKDQKGHAHTPARCAAAAQHVPCEQCKVQEADRSPGYMTAWALAA